MSTAAFLRVFLMALAEPDVLWSAVICGGG